MKIWLNRWFSTAFNIIEELKTNYPNQFEVIISHPNQNSINLLSGNLSFVEEEFKIGDENYVEYCLDICKTHKIDGFLPYFNAPLIAKHKARFEAIGVKVMVFEDVAKLEIINDKELFYLELKKIGIENIPKYRAFNDESSFLKTLVYFDEVHEGEKICIKPASGVGGNGFHIVRKKPRTFDEILNSSYSTEILLVEFIDSIFQKIFHFKEFEKIMMMELLNGHEVSVDVLADKDGNYVTSVTRKKVSSYQQKLFNEPELNEIVQKIASHFKVPYLYNVQFMYKNGIPYVLEMNPRMSGGCYISQESGVDLFYGAVCELLDLPYAINKDFTEKTINKTSKLI